MQTGARTKRPRATAMYAQEKKSTRIPTKALGALRSSDRRERLTGESDDKETNTELRPLAYHAHNAIGLA
ncbi:hypothetical protein N9L68_02010 [bacterium]|nr:hypothetical protein [bacterium]